MYSITLPQNILSDSDEEKCEKEFSAINSIPSKKAKEWKCETMSELDCDITKDKQRGAYCCMKFDFYVYEKCIEEYQRL